MARVLGFIKWVAVPLAVACSGYFLVGPSLIPNAPVKPASAPPNLSTDPEPEIVPEASVEAPPAKPEPARKRRTRKKPKPSQKVTPPETPEPPPVEHEEPPATDSGGSGGAATAGAEGLPPEGTTRVG